MDIIITYIMYLGVAVVTSELIEKSALSKVKSKKIFFLIIAVLICGMLAAFRNTTGTDSAMYIRAYYYGVDSINRIGGFEVGYTVLTQILKFFGFSHLSLFFAANAITSLFIFLTIFIERESIDVKLASFIYVMTLYFWSFNAMRQAIAIAIGMYATSLFIKKYYIQSLVLFIFAVSFHTSAVIYILVIGGKWIFQSKYKKWFMLVFFGFALYLVTNRELFANAVKIVFNFVHTNRPYAGYISRDAETDGSIIKYYIKIIPVVFVTVSNFKNYICNKRMYVYFGLVITGRILSSLDYITATQVGRMGTYFYSFEIVLLAFCAVHGVPLFNHRRLNSKTTTILLYMYIIAIFSYDYFIKGFGAIVPYRGLFIS